MIKMFIIPNLIHTHLVLFFIKLSCVRTILNRFPLGKYNPAAQAVYKYYTNGPGLHY